MPPDATTKPLLKALTDLRTSRIFLISTVAVAVFVDLFLYGLVIPILPTILADRAHVAPSKVQVTLSGLLAAYNAAMIVCAPISGYLADKWSNRKIPLLGGLFALAGSTLLFMLSKNVGLLYLARILQGASASIVWSVGLALLVDGVGGEGMGAAMGWVTLALSLGNVCGPLLGGVVHQRSGNNATFIMAFAVIALDIVLRCLLREPRSQATAEALTSNEAQAEPDSPSQPTVFSVSAEKSNETVIVIANPSDQQPSLKKQQENQPSLGKFKIFKLLTYPDLLRSLWFVFLITCVLTGLEAIIPLHVESTFRWSSQGTGLVFIALVLPIFLGPAVGMLYDRIGARPLTTTGLLLATIFGPLLALIRSFSVSLIVLFVFFLLVIGLSVSLVMTPEMAYISMFPEMISKNDPEAFGPQGATAQCCALLTISTAAGGVIGPIMAGAIQSKLGWIAASVTIGLFAALGLVVLLIELIFARLKTRAETDNISMREEAGTHIDVADSNCEQGK